MLLSTDRLIELFEMELLSLKAEGTDHIPLRDDYKYLINEVFSNKDTWGANIRASEIFDDIPDDNGQTEHTKCSDTLVDFAPKQKHSNTANKICTNPVTHEIKEQMFSNCDIECHAIDLPDGTKKEQYEWLKSLVLNNEEFISHVRPGKKLVFGIGNLDADIFFCGEAPGADEETQGAPFVGRAGQLLTKIILAMGITRENVYISNIMNWRPEMPTEFGNRPPTRQEMNICLPYLLAQIRIVQPKVIVALGATAVKGLLGDSPSLRMHDIRGKWKSFADTQLIATFHPSYLLRNSTNATKRLVWEDMLLVMERVGMPISEKQRSYFL